MFGTFPISRWLWDLGPDSHFTPQLSGCGLKGVRSYLATESPFLATGYHITYHFGLYLYQFLYQLFLRCISPCPPYSTNFFWRLCHKRMPSRHEEKGGCGMSISASSVILAAWSSSWWGFPAEAVAVFSG